ncbi:hypothetical protein [Ilumatobacter sp.]|uniref:hypothetical protein n=1 Tax=Ilumatobacter sp. TaxID=1967498 RepID=UPI003B523F20
MATPSSSSTKKAARLAQKGKGQKVRFQGGALFPIIVALVVVLGSGLVVYARQTRPTFDDVPPTEADHWHHVYGFYLCDQWVQLTGDAEGTDSAGNPVNTDYVLTGIHSHDDGLIHWHPFSPAAIGSRAQLGVFLDVYGVELDSDQLTFPDDQLGQLPDALRETGEMIPGETECEITGSDGEVSTESADIQVTVWNNLSDTEGQTFRSAFDQIRLDRDAMVVSIGFVPDGTDLEKPPWTDTFDEAAANDQAQLDPDQLFPGVQVDGEDVTIDSVPIDDVPIGSAVTGAEGTSAPAGTTGAEDEAES